MKIEIRPLTGHAEFGAAVRLQKGIWGFDDIDVLPLRFFVVATKIGGQALGAFDGDRMVGFCIGIPGLKSEGKTYLHSHMLGVLPEYRDKSLGRQMKLAQRAAAIQEGLDLIEWTFDPLEIKNAYFNIERLGAIVRRYVPNQYGTSSSPLHGGLPTDRCVAEWWIQHPRVEALLAGQPMPRPRTEERVSIPSDVASIRSNRPERAREIQLKASEELRSAFRRGLAVIGFENSPDAGTYLLGRWESN